MTKRALIDEQGKTCTKCDTYKPFGEFYNNARTKDGKQSWCKGCSIKHTTSAASAKSRTKTLENRAANRIHYTYNLTEEQAAKVVSITNCESCGRKVSREDRTAHTDHDYVTGEYRGVLCPSCNTGIGKLGDNLEGLEKASYYLASKLDMFELAGRL